jgi:diaminohydroxyphosphoribosylaminopyrimidine deaminase/5-amino-6-(5-phosphoribosylamino)uracil reductase
VDPSDEDRMRQAMAVAAAARRTVSPRPWVGAVVVPRDAPGDHPGFAGATTGRDGPHAEVVALTAAGSQADGATLYTTLEPCCHTGRTGPCTKAIIDAGVARVVVGVVDPDVQVGARGVAELEAAGIEVNCGVAGEAVSDQLEPYLVHRRTGRPYVVLKLAASFDGATAAPDGTSKWITGDEARRDAHRLRADSDAIVVGAGTVRSDDPQLTVRLDHGELPEDFVDPRRVVLGAVPAGAKVSPATEWRGDPAALLDELGRDGALQVLVEGGAGVAAQFHAARLVDRYVLYLAPLLMGGDDARGLFAGPGAATLADGWRGRIAAVTQLGDDLRVDLVPRTEV